MYGFDPASLSDALLLANSLLAQNIGAPQEDIKRGLFADGIPLVQSQTNDGDDTKVRTTILSDGNTTFLFFSATHTARMGRTIVLRYAMAANENPGFGEQVAFANIAIESLRGVAGSIPPNTRNFVVAGYSAGAAVALFVATSLNDFYPNAQVQFVQFNPPRPAVREYGQRARSTTGFRWHNDDDKISRLCFHSNEASVAGRLTPQSITDNANRWEQCGRGCSVSSTGALAFLDVFETPPFPDSQALSLFGWGLGIDTDAVVSHDIGTLARRLALAVTIPANQVPRVALFGRVGPASGDLPADGGLVAQLPPAQVPGNDGFIGQHAVPQIVVNQQGLNNIVPGYTKQSGDAIYYAQKLNKKWYVMYLASPLYGPVSRSQARKDAARLNAVAKHALAAADTDPSGLGNSISYAAGGDL